MEAKTTQPILAPPTDETPVDGENLRYEVATQWQLMWWKFRKHRLAMISLVIVLMYYFVALFADFFAPTSSTYYDAEYVYAPPQEIQLFRDGQFSPYVYGYKFERDPVSRKKTWSLDTETQIPIGLFVKGESYNVLGIFPTDIHLIGPVEEGQPFFWMGTDKSGRDIFSRIIFSARISLSVGLVGVAISMMLGILLGGYSARYRDFTVRAYLADFACHCCGCAAGLAGGTSVFHDYDPAGFYRMDRASACGA
jgi:peptide/nickel transport system permease protein